jgi:hypothetical protein
MKEIHEQIKVCSFMTMYYPGVIFCSDLSGLKLSKATANMVKTLKSRNGFPDLFIFEPNEKYKALFIEMKITGFNIFKKDKKSYKTEHLAEQADMINELKKTWFLCPVLFWL